MSAPTPAYAVVVPTIGRPSLQALLTALAGQDGPRPQEVVVVDDRPRAAAGDLLAQTSPLSPPYPVRVVRSFGHGPAAARNLGWRLARAPWVVFLDDDVLVPEGWAHRLAGDLTGAGDGVGGVQGRLEIPPPTGRRPTDVERGTLGLAGAAWATADMAYRRAALEEVDGFDERFPRAFREDADLAVRVLRAGWTLQRGERTTIHPLRPPAPGDATASLRAQRGNADDALMRRLHGPAWRRVASAPPGRLRWHVVTVATALAALGAALSGRRRAAALGAAGWLALTADFAVRRVRPGPRDAAEARAMALTSAAIPPAAVAWRLRGWWRSRTAAPWPPPVKAVLFDRDGTLVHDVPYNGDPDLVEEVKGAAEVVARLRRAGVRVGVVTNQSGIARGLLSPGQVAAVNAAVDARLGPFGTWQVCPHSPQEGCACRKPAPGMILAGAAALGVSAREVAVIGDIGADVEAARAAGARGVLVPTPATRAQEVADAPLVAASLDEAVDLLLGATGNSPGSTKEEGVSERSELTIRHRAALTPTTKESA